MLGEKLRELREKEGLLQRQVAALMEVDTAYISKMEKNDKPVSKIHLKAFAKIYKIKEGELIPYWLGEKILHSLKGEKLSKEAIQLVLKNFNEVHG